MSFLIFKIQRLERRKDIKTKEAKASLVFSHDGTTWNLFKMTPSHLSARVCRSEEDPSFLNDRHGPKSVFLRQGS